MKKIIFLLGIVFAQDVFAGTYPVVLDPESALPSTVIVVSFKTGSIDDPTGKKGLAHLTAELLRQGGVKSDGDLPARSREEIEDFLFPLASEIAVSTSKEQTTFYIKTSKTSSKDVFHLLTQMLISPALDEKQFDRLKDEAIDYLSVQLPREDQEELGKHVLDYVIYGKHHPYSSPVEGKIADLKMITLDDIKSFHKKYFSQARLIVAASGSISKEMNSLLSHVFAKLPVGQKPEKSAIPSSKKIPGVHLTFVKGPFEAVGVHLGFEISTLRNSKSFPALYLGNMGFGKHRSFVGRLMHEVREVRGLNYGTFSYVEDFPGGGSRLNEPVNESRSRQAFSIWARPTTPENGCFLMKQVFYEFDQFRKKGLTKKEFVLAKSHLIGTAPLMAQDALRKLGYAIDSSFYGIKGSYLAGLEKGARQATFESTNKQIKSEFDSDSIQVVVVTSDPERFKKEIESTSCNITYGPGIEKSKEVAEKDKAISKIKIPFEASSIQTLDSQAIWN